MKTKTKPGAEEMAAWLAANRQQIRLLPKSGTGRTPRAVLEDRRRAARTVGGQLAYTHQFAEV